MPNLYIIAGCNGAGKTTASFNVLPEILDCHEFLNADAIAKAISPFQPESTAAAMRAGRIMLAQIDELLEQQKDFAIETTLTTKSYQKTVQLAKTLGYDVTLLFFWLNSEELAVTRVKQRVKEGGHNIPEEIIRRRYHRGIFNLLNIFSDICDNYMIIDNSTEQYVYIAERMDGQAIIHSEELFRFLKQQAHEKE